MQWLVELLRINGFSPETITALATAFYATIALATLAAVIYIGVFQLKQMREDSHKQLIKNLIETWEGDPMLNSRKVLRDVIQLQASKDKPAQNNKEPREEADRLKKALRGLAAINDENFFFIIRIANYLETMGYLMRSKSDRKKICELMGDAIIHYFTLFEPWLKEERKTTPRICEYFEALYKSCRTQLK